MANFTKQDIFEIITEYLETYGSAIGENSVRELTAEELQDTDNMLVLTIPGMIPLNAPSHAGEWVQTNMANMIRPITQAVAGWNALEASVRQAVANVAGAENLDVNMSTQSGAIMLTVTNRAGLSTTKEVGFRIVRTYASVAAMNADAANIAEGRFVMISGSVEDPDTGKLYVRNGTGAETAFTFLTDLSGAQGIKGDTPVITAAQDGTLYADGVLLTEVIKIAVAAVNSATVLAQEYNSHPPYIADGTQAKPGNVNYWYIWSHASQQYVKDACATGDDLDWASMTEQQKQDLANRTADVTYDSQTNTLKKTKNGQTSDVVQVYTKAQIDDMYLIPVDQETLSPSTTFIKGNVLPINGKWYRALAATDEMPLTMVIQDGQFVYDEINGERVYLIADDTLNSDWEIWSDASIGYYIQMLLRMQPLTGSGAPTVPPTWIGQEYIDCTTPALYKAKAVTNSTSDWFKV